MSEQTEDQTQSGIPNKHPLQEIIGTDEFEALNSLPEPIRSQMMSSLSITSRSRVGHPLFDKFNDEHISKYLDGIQKDNEYELRKSNRYFYLATFIISVVALGILIAYLAPRDKDLLENIIAIMSAFLGGAGAGYGYANLKE